MKDEIIKIEIIFTRMNASKLQLNNIFKNVMKVTFRARNNHNARHFLNTSLKIHFKQIHAIQPPSLELTLENL